MLSGYLAGSARISSQRPKRTSTSSGTATKPSANDAFSFTNVRRQFRDHRADMFHREFALSGHHRGIGQHVVVVRGIDREQPVGGPTIFR